MCGIAGFVHLDGRPLDHDEDGPTLERMGEAMRHRGPDDSRITLWNNVGLVFRRLSINDLAGGAQPFHTSDGRITSITNGEVYNHRALRSDLARRHVFRSQSDCEVVPYLYLDRGLDLFEPVNGMFASALLDRRLRRLLLARDRLGEKPLFHCVLPNGRTLVFASEIKALFAYPGVPRRLDWDALLTRVQNFDLGVGERPSGFAGIERIPAGSLLDISLDDGRLRLHRYWSLPEQAAEGDARDAEGCVEGYRELLADSVRLREVADVGCGLFLSGGIDSSAVAALVSGRGGMPTFSIHNASTRGDADAAAAVAAHLDMPNHQVSFDRAATRLTPDDWRRILWTCEYPDIGAEQLFKYYLHAYARREYPGLKVMLLGQGSDEFNGGYLSMIVDGAPPYAPEDWQRMGERILDNDTTHIAHTSGLVGRAGVLVRNGVIRRDFISRLGGRQGGRTIWDAYVRRYRGNLDCHLWHEDRTAAAHSIEDRLPFLDHRLVEFLARVPATLHAELFTDKAILRRAMSGLLPPEIVHRRKGPLFYGDQQHHTFRMMHALLVGQGGELLEQAAEGSRLTDGPIDGARLVAMARQLAEDPGMAQLEQFMVIVNMGVLAYLAATLAVPAAAGSCLPVDVGHDRAGAAPLAAGHRAGGLAGVSGQAFPWV